MIKTYKITVNGKSYDVTVEEGDTQATSVAENKVNETKEVAAKAAQPSVSNKKGPEISGAIEAPMPGKVLKIAVAKGDKVEAGQLLLLLEAMKMENEIFAPVSGTVTEIVVSAGDNVNTGDALIVIA